MLYLTYTMISSVDLAHYEVSCAKIGYLCIVVQGNSKRVVTLNKDMRESIYGCHTLYRIE